MRKPSRAAVVGAVGIAAALSVGAACSSSANSGTHAKQTTTSFIPVPSTGPQVPSPFTEGQRAGLPGDLELTVTEARRAAGSILVSATLANDRATALALGAAATLFTFRPTLLGADTPATAASHVPASVAPGASAQLQLAFPDPGTKAATQPTLFFHGDLVGSDKATVALLSLLPAK